MNRLQNLIDDLNDSNRLSNELESTDDDFARLNLHSVRKRRDELVEAIDRELATTQTSIVQYRIRRSAVERYPAKAVGEALEKFQDLLTSVYDALVNGPKKRFRPSPESIERTTLNFAGATAGSVKIVLATEDDRLLMGDTQFERALVLVEKTLSAQTTDDLSALSSEVGIASISKAYEWAASAATYGLGSEISWGKQIAPERTFTIAPEEAARVSALIAVKSDEVSTNYQMIGILHGFDKQTSYFHLETLDSHEHFKGEVAEEVPQMLTTGAVYLADVSKTVSVVYSTGEEKEKWTLRGLTPVEKVSDRLE